MMRTTLVRSTIKCLLLFTALGVVGGCGGGAASSPADHLGLANRHGYWSHLSRRGVRQERAHGFHADQSPFLDIGTPKTMPPGMLKAALGVLGQSGPARLGFGRARYVTTPLGVGLWVVVGRGVTCMFQARTAAMSCNTTYSASRRGLFLGVYALGRHPSESPSRFLSLGITPTWAKTIHFRVGRQKRQLHIMNGVFAIRTDRPIQMGRLEG